MRMRIVLPVESGHGGPTGSIEIEMTTGKGEPVIRIFVNTQDNDGSYKSYTTHGTFTQYQLRQFCSSIIGACSSHCVDDNAY